MLNQISYALSKWEVLHAALEQILWQHRRAWRTTVVLYGVLTGIVVNRWLKDPTVVAGLELLGSITVVIAFYLVFTLQRVWRAYHQAGHLGRKYLVTITEDGITFEVDFDAITLSWRTFSGYADSRGFFLLAHRTGGSFALPKRAFHSPEQIQHWQKMLARHVRA